MAMALQKQSTPRRSNLALGFLVFFFRRLKMEQDMVFSGMVNAENGNRSLDD